MRISDWSSDVCSSDLLVNDRPEDGISGSIIRAVEHVMPMRKCRGILICLADMPDVPQTHYNRICLAAEDIRSVVASTDGFSASPPAFIGRKHFPELLALRGDQGVRALLSHGVQIETMGASLRDIDTPDALAERRSEEHKSERQSLMRTSYAVFC